MLSKRDLWTASQNNAYRYRKTLEKIAEDKEFTTSCLKHYLLPFTKDLNYMENKG